MAKKDRKCICCKAEYAYCPDCNGVDKLKPTWYSEFCSEDCKELWLTATKFNMQLMTKEEAKEIIEMLKLKDKKEYVKCVQRDLDVILKKEEVQEKQYKNNFEKPVKKSHEVVKKEYK